VQAIYKGQEEWDVLFRPSDFFQKYRHYIVVIAKADCKDHLMEWYVYGNTLFTAKYY
jgi:poly(A) polymerase